MASILTIVGLLSMSWTAEALPLRSWCPFIFTSAQRLISNPLSSPVPAGLERMSVGGKTVYARFSMHEFGHRSRAAALLEESNTSQEFLDHVRRFTNEVENRRLVESLHETRIAIQQALSAQNIRWVGLEFSPVEAGGSIVNLDSQSVDYLGTRSALARILPELELNDLMALMYDPVIILKSTHPHLFVNVNLIPLDDSMAKPQVFEVVEALRQTIVRIVELGIRESAVTPYEMDRILRFRSAVMTLNRSIPEDEAEEFVESFNHPMVRLHLLNMMEQLNRFVALNAQRDATMARVIEQQTGTGLIQLGSQHRAGVYRNLGITPQSQ